MPPLYSSVWLAILALVRRDDTKPVERSPCPQRPSIRKNNKKAKMSYGYSRIPNNNNNY